MKAKGVLACWAFLDLRNAQANYFLSTILLSIFVYADFTGTVVNITDGDTVNVLEAGNVLHKVRLTGIDAPERG